MFLSLDSRNKKIWTETEWATQKLTHIQTHLTIEALGLIHTRYVCTQYCDKKILIILSHGFQWTTKVSSSKNSTQGILGFIRAYLGWSIETYV